MIKNLETRIKLKRDTKENWDNAVGFVPLDGEIIVYEDYPGNWFLDSSELPSEAFADSDGKVIMGIKVGDGKAYVQDLPFISDDVRKKLINHINDMEVHLILGDREFWDSKVDIEDFDGYEQRDLWGDDNDTLIITREDWYNSLNRERRRRDYEPEEV